MRLNNDAIFLHVVNRTSPSRMPCSYIYLTLESVSSKQLSIMRNSYIVQSILRKLPPYLVSYIL